MVHRLARDGFVELLRDRQIRLTKAGQDYAEKIVRRHRLAERLLIDILGLDWSLAHEEAAKFEHVISEAVEERIVAIVEDPTTCPHGNPIPGIHVGPPKSFAPLASAKPGSRIVLRRVTEDVEIDYPTLCYLDRQGFIPGRMAKVVAVAPDGSLTLDVGGSPMAIGADLAQHLYVEPAPA
jgi:DtxR family Mn-dependent transcriptional regulator